MVVGVQETRASKNTKTTPCKVQIIDEFHPAWREVDLQGRLTRRAKQAQDCIIAACEFAVAPDAIKPPDGRSGSRRADSSFPSQNCMLDVRIRLPSAQARHGNE